MTEFERGLAKGQIKAFNAAKSMLNEAISSLSRDQISAETEAVFRDLAAKFAGKVEGSSGAGEAQGDMGDQLVAFRKGQQAQGDVPGLESFDRMMGTAAKAKPAGQDMGDALVAYRAAQKNQHQVRD